MSPQLTSDSSLDTLRKEAKRWLKAIRSGDARAIERLRAALGTAARANTTSQANIARPAGAASPASRVAPSDRATPATLTLRDVQLALAREYGLPGWTALREALDDLALARRSRAELVDAVLRAAHWNGDRAAAARVLARWPEIGTDNLHIAAATGNLTEVQRRLKLDPASARRSGGPLGWEPLLYLAYARLPGSEAHGVAIATALLDHGADPNARWSDDWKNPFTALTGVIGEGEGDKPPHPQAKALAALLVARGAHPFDTQALYNTSITRDDTTWLDFLWDESERRGLLELWRAEPAHSDLGGKLPMKALDYLLGNAVAYNHLKRAEWLLAHGANPNGLHAYSKRKQREEALVYGHQDMADLLVRFGAEPAPLPPAVAFQSACMRLDAQTARRLASKHPECLTLPDPMLIAARAGRIEVVTLLLELGMNVDIMDAGEQRALQLAVASDSLDIVKLLLAHGADIDRPTKWYGGALGFAAHFGRQEIAELLAPRSRDVWNLSCLGMRERLEALFAAEPALVNARHARSGSTPLFTLPDDEDAAEDMAAFLLAHGADPNIRNDAGLTAENATRQRGLVDAADLIRSASQTRP